MDLLRAFSIKFIAIGVLTFSIFGFFFHATIGRLLLMTLVVAGVTFLMDLFILPKVNQAIAAIADFPVLFLLYWALGNLVVESNVSIFIPAFAAAYFGVLIEAVYHIYMMERIHESDPSTPTPVPVRYQTEFAEESNINSEVEQKDKDKKDSK